MSISLLPASEGSTTHLCVCCRPDHPVDAAPFVLPTSLPPLPKRAPKLKEETPPPPETKNGLKRSAPDDIDDEIQVIEPGAPQTDAHAHVDGQRPIKQLRASGPNGSKRAPDDDTTLERNAKRLRLVSAEVEVVEEDDDDEIVILE